MSAGQRWFCFLIVALALALRVVALDLKPAHFDEGVNGSFVDNMRTDGCYKYDPANYHGPLHFYVLFAGQQLFGRSLWVLRMPTALIGAATVALMFAFRRFLPWSVVSIGATAMAISPAMVFCSRYAIHEAWLPFFSMLAAYGGFAIARGDRRTGDLWALGLGLAGMVLTKETYLVHWIAAFLAFCAVRILGPATPATPGKRTRRPAVLFSSEDAVETDGPEIAEEPVSGKFSASDVAQVTFVCAGLVVFFYSGFFLNWPGVFGLYKTFHLMMSKATISEAGHNKEFFYWVKLLAWYEWPALIGLFAALIISVRRSPALAVTLLTAGVVVAAGSHIAPHGTTGANEYLRPHWNLDTLTSLGLALAVAGLCFFVASPASDPLIRWLGLYGLATMAAYSLIPYKTPWCIINIVWPFFFLLGESADRLSQTAERRIMHVVIAILTAASLNDAVRLNFRDPTEDGDRYAYVQTTFDINKLLRPVRELVKITPAHRQMHGLVMIEAFPLVWELNEFPNVSFLEEDANRENYDADFLLVPGHREDAVQTGLLGVYFKERYHPRGGTDDAWLYLSAERFGPVLPGREPEFRPRIPQPNPTIPADEPRQ